MKLLRPKRSLGQNFLMHAHIAERIVNTARLAPDAIVLEIGPGTGILTRALLQRAGKVIAVETDYELFEKLQTDFVNEISEGRLELVHSDIRTFDISSLPRNYSLAANIPYYLTGEIFRMFFESDNQPSVITLLVQKEVAERIARSNPDAKRSGPRLKHRGKESILSLSVKVYGVPKYEFTVPRGAFNPAPKVDSAVLTIRDISRKHFVSREQEQRFFEIVRAGFAHKRKFVRKNLIDAGLQAGDIPEKARAEDLPLLAWLALSKVEGPT